MGVMFFPIISILYAVLFIFICDSTYHTIIAHVSSKYFTKMSYILYTMILYYICMYKYKTYKYLYSNIIPFIYI